MKTGRNGEMKKRVSKKGVTQEPGTGRGFLAGDEIFLERLKRHHDELRWLFMELYDNDAMFAELCDRMKIGRAHV